MSAFYDLNKTPRNILNQAIVRAIISENNGAWFDPEDLSTMFQDSAGTTPVTALEQPVGKWLDKSGNGNHATQSITASRPTLSARYNLLTKTEDFTDAVWEKALCTVTNVAISNPLNKSVVSKFVLDSTTGVHRISQQWNPVSGAKYSQGVILKYAGVRYVNINTNANLSVRLCIDLQTGQYTTSVPYPENPIVIYLGDGWYYASITGTGTSATGNKTWFQANRTLASGDDSGYTGDGVSGFYIIAAQLNQTQSPLPYQRVNTATDYDSVGWPRYIRFDGIDDYLNLPYMGLYANGSASCVSVLSTSPAATQRIIHEASTLNVAPWYGLIRFSSGSIGVAIVDDSGSVIVGNGGAFGGYYIPKIISTIDTGLNARTLINSSIVDSDNYSRSGRTVTLNTTAIGASVSLTTTGFLNGNITGGLIITKSALSDTDRRRCEQFLASRLSTLGVTLS